ncbi:MULTISPECIES: peptidase M50 [Mesorhizobium]|uniref:peptidase M50 n=3 Tax=Phyllobacteriaceae TaxID=69277 RepID=UPI001F1E5651|nr:MULTISPECIES: peptidase M50 [Mesorhizobium]MCF6125804.1 peptidase M50 [Mesorhizobium ciceri]MCQ8817988.1 peptidase M50 [Mesorhizobium sp. SEMIA396]
MDGSYFSSSWYRVAQLKPRLRSQVSIHRTIFRNQVWYVMQDRTSGRFHRFTPEAYFIISLMTGRRTMQDVWDNACEHLDEKVITQDAVIRLLGQLHAADVLFGDIPPDIEEIADRASKQHNRKLLSKFANPLAIRVGLFDPNEFLNATYPLVRPFLSWFGGVAFLALVAYSIFLAAMNWQALTGDVTDRVLSAENIVLILIAYPFIKALHELGHAFAVKRWGGEVHEIGVMLLVFMPVPYVDASESLAFRDKWQRALVGAAGIIVEGLLACLALIVWLNAEAGLVRAFAFNVMLIGGVSTLLFNGNPLLRFDGYYVLSDILEIPNLGQRATKYLGYLVQHYLFGIESAETPATAQGEEFWLFSYGVTSFFYRIGVMVAIVTLVSQRYFVVGMMMAGWALVLMVGVPLARQLWFLFTSPSLRKTRGRAFAVVAASLALVASPFFVIPLPYATAAQGVVWLPGDGVVNAGVDGVVAEIVATPGARIERGDPILRLEDPLLEARTVLLDLRVGELERRLEKLDVSEKVNAKVVAEELRLARADLVIARDRAEALTVRAQASGTLIVPSANDLEGKFVRRGETLAYVTRFDQPTLRAVIPEGDADLVRNHTEFVDVRFVEDPSVSHSAKIIREVPSLTATLPNAALSTVGGGQFSLDPTDHSQKRVLANLMHLELALANPSKVDRIGGRIYVRFFHGNVPLYERTYRWIRQVFLRVYKV